MFCTTVLTHETTTVLYDSYTDLIFMVLIIFYGYQFVIKRYQGVLFWYIHIQVGKVLDSKHQTRKTFGSLKEEFMLNIKN